MSALRKLVYIGVTSEDRSLNRVKSVTMLTRVILISLVVLVFYAIAVYVQDMTELAMTYLVLVPLFLFIYYLIYLKKPTQAGMLYGLLILVSFSYFSVYLGDGHGSKFWVIVMSPISLLIFEKRIYSILIILISFLTYLLINYLQGFVEPTITLDPFLSRMTYLTNIFFIFCTSFVLSFVLRFSNDDFEERLARNTAVIKRKNRELTSSINYAYRIQNAVLPNEKIQAELGQNFFSLFEPRDIVSGDFYWVYPIKGKVLFAVVDGVGHGVTGALVSIMAHTMLSQCVEDYHLSDPTLILEKMKALILERKTNGSEAYPDKMEITLCSYDWKNAILDYASTGNAIYLLKHVDQVLPEDGMVRESEDRYVMKEIRKKHGFGRANLSEAEIISGSHYFQKDDMLYLATNGFASQVGGPAGKKFKSARLKNLLMSVQHLGLKKQKSIISDVLENWRGKHLRTDDITLLGFRV